MTAGIHAVQPPSGIIQRIGSRRRGGPLAWPSLEWIRGGASPGGVGRFDDPRGAASEYTVLYGATSRAACFAETLASFRVARERNPFADRIRAIAPLALGDPLNFDVDDVIDVEAPRRIPDHFFASKAIGFFKIRGRLPLLDVRITATATADALSLAPDMTVGPIKPGDFVGDNREKTQAISLWARQHDFGGLLYTSSHDLDAAWECVALFPSMAIEHVRAPIAVARTDPDLFEIARRFNLLL